MDSSQNVDDGNVIIGSFQTGKLSTLMTAPGLCSLCHVVFQIVDVANVVKQTAMDMTLNASVIMDLKR